MSDTSHSISAVLEPFLNPQKSTYSNVLSHQNIFLSIVVAKKTVDLILPDLYFTAGHVYPQQDYDILLLEMCLKMF